MTTSPPLFHYFTHLEGKKGEHDEHDEEERWVRVCEGGMHTRCVRRGTARLTMCDHLFCVRESEQYRCSFSMILGKLPDDRYS